MDHCDRRGRDKLMSATRGCQHGSPALSLDQRDRLTRALSSGGATLAASTKRRQPARTDPGEDREGLTLRTRRERRLRRTAGFILTVAAFVAVAIAISRGSGTGPPKPGSPQARVDVADVSG